MNNFRLIINTDDFGLNSNKNKDIAYCFKEDLINSTTILVNTSSFGEGLQMAENYSFKEQVGIHLKFEGKPLTDLQGTGLLNEEGNFIKKAIDNRTLFFTSVTRSKIHKEINAQFK